MAGGKETPRQKMIGMMYLVLTALLAMNVSKDILNAFVIINDGIQKTNLTFESKNETQYSAFEVAEANDPIKVKKFNDKAKQVKALSKELNDYIENLKKHLIKNTDKLDDAAPDSLYKLKNVNSKDNYDIPTMILIGEPAAPNTGEWSAAELKGKINTYRDALLNVIEDEERRKSMNIGLETTDFGEQNGTFETWETGIFYHVPLAACVTALSKIQSDVRNAESDIVKELFTNISADDFKFDTLAAKVIPSSRYVFLGDSFKAEVMVAAFSTTQNPKLEVGFKLDTAGNPIDKDSSGVTVNRGVARFGFMPRSEGITEWGGVISIKSPKGDWKPYKFKDEFIVAKPTLVVSPTAMNVFYRGLENPVEVSAPGVPPEKVNVSITNGQIIPKNKQYGQYIVKPGSGGDAVVRVSADVGGKTKQLGEAKFRVKDVPKPEAEFAGVKGSGNAPLTTVKSQAGVMARLENFQFENVKFTVKSFSLSMMYKGSLVEAKSNSNRLTDQMTQMLGAAAKGTKIFIEDIKAEGPGGVVNLGGVSVKVL